ncbi:MAG: hypothetical protein OHK0031_00060 [Anaerolineales bacterium]
MSHPISSTDFEEIARLHQANYAIFRARSEDELRQAITQALHSRHFLSLYYNVTDNGLELILAHDPRAQKVEGAAEFLDFSAADVAKYFSGGPEIVSLEKAKLPDELLAPLRQAECRQCVILPVVADVVTQGVILLGSRAAETPSQEQIAPFVQCAETIPVAQENIRAARATQQRLRELEAISETGQAISSSSDLSSLYQTLHKQIRATIGETGFLVAIYNKESETIEIPYMYSEGKVGTSDPFPLGEGLISILIRTRQPLMLVEDTERRSRALGAKYVGQPAKSWLGCPLIVGGEAVGALVLQDVESENRFNQNDQRFLISLSAQVAGAIYNTRLLAEARQRALQLQTVAEISREVSSSLIVDNLLRQAVNLIRERFNFYHASVFLVDSGGEYAVIREATGEAGNQLKRAGHKLAVGSKSIVGSVAQAAEALIVNDISKNPNYYANPLLPDTKAEAAMPLRVGERVLGVLDVQSTHPYAFTDETIKIMQILADQLAVAVVNSELFAEAQERLSQHRLLHHVTTAAASSSSIEEALNSAVQGLQVTMGGDQIAIMLADNEHKTLQVKASVGYANQESSKLEIPFGVGITGWVAAHRQAQRVGDVSKDSRFIALNSKVRSELAIPLIYRNEVLGVLNVESPRPMAYSENDEEMLGTLAGSLAAIISHSQLLEQFRTQVERERILYEVANRIRRTSSSEKIIAITASELGKTLSARQVAIRLNLGAAQGDSRPSGSGTPKAQ